VSLKQTSWFEIEEALSKKEAWCCLSLIGAFF
jgi:hypothetical protein